MKQTINWPLTLLLLQLLWLNNAVAEPLKVGDIAPDFKVMTTDNKVFQLNQLRGKKPVYVVFWNTWCPYCVKKMPEYQETFTFHGDELAFIAINTGRNDAYDNILPFTERHQLDFPIAYDFGQKISQIYDVIGSPTAFIIDINGRIRYRNGVPEDVESYIASWSTP